MFLAKSQAVLISDIIVEERQRTSIDDADIAALADSIKRIGLIHPIVLDGEMRLLVGGHRLAACKLLGWDKIPVRFNNTEDPNEKAVIELEENLKRVDLPWQDRCKAILRIHEAYQGLDPKWTQEKTSMAIGLKPPTVAEAIQLAEEMQRGNKTVAQAGKMSEAKSAVKRARGKELANITNTLFAKPKDPNTPQAPVPTKPVICADFLEWSGQVQEQKFDVIHCDFPYGVNMDKSGQVSHALGLYKDSKDVYFQLLDGFVTNYFNFAQPVSHIMFWFSMNYYTETVAGLSQIKNAKVLPFPLIWHKSDGKGMLPDQMREGRRVYETALLVSVGDRYILKAKDNLFGCGLDPERDHQAAKPKPMLEHFFTMLIEPGVRLLDPTCGSGNALVAARSLGAEVFGIELNPEFVERIKL